MKGAGNLRVVVSWSSGATPFPAERSALRLLNLTERERLRRARRPEDRDRFLRGVVQLRTAAGQLLSLPPEKVLLDRLCAQCGQPHGPVRVRGTDLSCSVSHSGSYVAVALTFGQSVGVDVEDSRVPRPGWRRVAAAAHAYGEPVPTTLMEFLRTWTAKEGVLKLTGEGLTRPMDSLMIGPDDGRRLGWREVLAPEHVRGVRVATCPLGVAMLSVAIRTDDADRVTLTMSPYAEDVA